MLAAAPALVPAAAIRLEAQRPFMEFRMTMGPASLMHTLLSPPESEEGARPAETPRQTAQVS